MVQRCCSFEEIVKCTMCQFVKKEPVSWLITLLKEVGYSSVPNFTIHLHCFKVLIAAEKEMKNTASLQSRRLLRPALKQCLVSPGYH